MKKIVLVTGSSGGIGMEIAVSLALNPEYDVIITGRNENKLKNISKETNINKFYVMDLLHKTSAKNLYEQVVKDFGGVDILVNNAGEYFYGKVENTTQDIIDRLITLNTKIPYEFITQAVPYMKKQNWGRIVNIGSISGVVGEANASLYSLTKSALTGMTKALALELAQNNITVNTINPGFVKTNLLENTFDDDFTKEELLDMIPQSRFIEPIEIANLVKYIVSDEAKGLTGQSINLCAGMSIG